jgi:hypothetical protein
MGRSGLGFGFGALEFLEGFRRACGRSGYPSVIVGAVMTMLYHNGCGVPKHGQPFNPNHHKKCGNYALNSRPYLLPIRISSTFTVKSIV